MASPRVGHVEVIEILSEIIGFLQDGLISLSTELLTEPRLNVRAGDVYWLFLARDEGMARP